MSCHPDCHHFAGDRLRKVFVDVGMWRGSCCYQEVWRSGGFCLRRASVWRTLSSLRHTQVITLSASLTSGSSVQKTRDKWKWKSLWAHSRQIRQEVHLIAAQCTLTSGRPTHIITVLLTVSGYLVNNHITHTIVFLFFICPYFSPKTPKIYSYQLWTEQQQMNLNMS